MEGSLEMTNVFFTNRIVPKSFCVFFFFFFEDFGSANTLLTIFENEKRKSTQPPITFTVENKLILKKYNEVPLQSGPLLYAWCRHGKPC